ncbi:protein amnionless [Pararge aegeria]|uniref:Protein amnionless n=1 Tax=Pararge aegeria aegeria TaxID=348720 RepID=A0A8S4S8Y5_9NEOP|nr:protein amnionless [Pararge aegeria]CAH2248412.1 jg6203 [Pararge aegeria aegeria]
MYRKRVLILLCYITTTLSAKVTWLPNNSFNLPNNFDDDKLPCSNKTVVFPEVLTGNVLIESHISVSGFILPENGEILLAEGVVMGLGPSEDLSCTAGNVYYKEKNIAKWSQPNVWSSPRFNDATPDAERLPCFDDVVIFPPNSTFTLELPEIFQKVKAIEINGENISTTLKEYILGHPNPAQQYILNQSPYQYTHVAIRNNECNSRSGCPCQPYSLTTDCSPKFCEKPTCADPIQPIGHCCKICGGAIVINVDESFDIMKFQELVERIVNTYGEDNLIYHIGRLQKDRVQVVVLDKYGYDQTSAKVVSALSNNLEKSLRSDMLVSGIPLAKSGLGGKLFISMFFAVVMVMAGVYVYYYKLPQINIPNIMGRNQAHMFSRFNRRTESVVSLTRRDSTAPIGARFATAFRNPLYDSKRGRVLVEE